MSIVRDTYRHIRSAIFSKRPLSSDVLDGEIAVNYHTDSVGVFLRDTAGKIRKVGPAHVSTLPPSPTNYTELSDGEMWIDKSGSTPLLKYYDQDVDEWISTGIFDFALDQDYIVVGNTSGAAAPYSLKPDSFFVDHTAGIMEVKLADNIEFGSYSFVSGTGITFRTIAFKVTVPSTDTDWVELEAYDASLYRSGKYIIEMHIVGNNSISVTELLVVHDNSDTYYTEYGAVSNTSNPLGEFRTTIVNVAGTNTVSLQFRRSVDVSGDIVIRSIQQSVF